MNPDLTEAVKLLRGLRQRADRLEEKSTRSGSIITRGKFVEETEKSAVVSVTTSTSDGIAEYNQDAYGYGEYQ